MTFGFDLFLYWVFHSRPCFCPMTRLWVVAMREGRRRHRKFGFELILLDILLLTLSCMTHLYIKKKKVFTFCLLRSLNIFYRGATAVLMHCFNATLKFPQF